MKFSELNQIMFNTLLLITICGLIVVCGILLKNKDLIMKDPLNYGMKVHNFTSCSCLDTNGKKWDSQEEGFLYKEKIDLNYNNLNFSEVINITH